jgi:hypothetical protein
LIVNYTRYLGLYLFQSVGVLCFMYFFPRLGAAATDDERGLKIFANHDPSLVIVLWLAYGLATISFAFFMSTCFSDKYIGVTVSIFLIVIMYLTAFIITDTALQTGDSGAPNVVLAGLLPMYALTNALQVMAAAAGDAEGKNGVRLTWSNAGTGPYSGVMGAVAMLIVDFVLYSLLFVYCDMVLPVGPGVKHHPLFFLQASYWKPSKFRAPIDTCKKLPEAGTTGAIRLSASACVRSIRARVRRPSSTCSLASSIRSASAFSAPTARASRRPFTCSVACMRPPRGRCSSRRPAVRSSTYAPT